MKWLALPTIAVFLASPALADGRPKVHTERPLRAVACPYYQPIPSALYDNFAVGQFNSNVWRPRYCAHRHAGLHRYDYQRRHGYHWQIGISGR
jgi:hypothetical protein